METEWGLIGGNIFHGELSADQLFHMRPAPGYADYRTPIAGLYQCSSATHGGGGVCGIPAYNCVREIRRDRNAPEEPVDEGAVLVHVLHRDVVPAVAVLAAHGRGRVHELGPLQPHADPHALRRRRDRVLAPARARRRCGTSPSSARSRSPAPTPRGSRSCSRAATCRGATVLQCKYAPIIAPDGGIVNDPILLRLGENHFWLSLADSDALLYALGVQAFAGMDVTIREPDVRPLQVQGRKSRDVIRDLFGDGGRGAPLLPVLGGRPGRHPGRRVAHGLDRRGRLRDLPARRLARHRALGPRDGGGRAVSDPSDRAERPAAARGRDLQLRQRHDGGGHAVPRDRMERLVESRRGLHRQGRARADRRGGRRPQARRRRVRRRAVPDVARGLLAGDARTARSSAG